MQAYFPYLIPIITPFILDILKKYLSGVMKSIPNWLKPVLASIVGLIAGYLSDTTTLSSGALLGLAGSGVYDIKHHYSKISGRI